MVLGRAATCFEERGTCAPVAVVGAGDSGGEEDDAGADSTPVDESAVTCVHPAEMGFDAGDVADSEFPTELPEGFVIPVEDAGGVPDSVAEEDFSGATDSKEGDSIEDWVKKIPQSTRDLLEKEFRMQYTRVVRIKNPLSK